MDKFFNHIKELQRQKAIRREHHVGQWEVPTSDDAKQQVAGFLGRIRLEWHLQDKFRSGR